MSTTQKLIDNLKAEVAGMKAERARLKEPVEPVTFKGGAPHVTTGAVGQDSKRFSLTNFLINGAGQRDPDKAKFELDAMNRLRKAINSTNSLISSAASSDYWLPLFDFDGLGDRVNDTEDFRYCKAVLSQGAPYDPDEHAWLARRGIVRKSALPQSAYTDTLGGTLVAPPQMGPVIPVVRPEAAFLAAGAQTLALPPQGRYVRPRITAPTVAQALGEGQTTPKTGVTTGQMVLQAKKIAGSVYISEEANNFTSGTMDSIVTQDLNRTLGLKLDAYGFYGTGGNQIPDGLTSAAYQNAVINVETAYASARGVGANGNKLLPEYGDIFPALIGERSFNTEASAGAWVMRPGAMAEALARRADAVTAGDMAGPLVDILRRFSDASPTSFRGRRVVQTTNIHGDKTKGSGTNLSDVFYGLWNHAIVGSYGAIQFTQGHDGNTFLNGQYIIRGVMFADIGFEYPEAFLYYPNVLGVTDVI